MIDVNVTGTFLMSQAVGKVMLEQQYGKIVNIASVAGLKGSDPKYMNAVGYNASKAAVINLQRTLQSNGGRKVSMSMRSLLVSSRQKCPRDCWIKAENSFLKELRCEIWF